MTKDWFFTMYSQDTVNMYVYQLTHGTSPGLQHARKGSFREWVILALTYSHQMPTYEDGLVDIYQQLLIGWHIANDSKPIMMESMTFGEFVRWFETDIFPKLNEEGARAHKAINEKERGQAYKG